MSCLLCCFTTRHTRPCNVSFVAADKVTHAPSQEQMLDNMVLSANGCKRVSFDCGESTASSMQDDVFVDDNIADITRDFRYIINNKTDDIVSNVGFKSDIDVDYDDDSDDGLGDEHLDQSAGTRQGLPDMMDLGVVQPGLWYRYSDSDSDVESDPSVSSTWSSSKESGVSMTTSFITSSTNTSGSMRCRGEIGSLDESGSKFTENKGLTNGDDSQKEQAVPCVSIGGDPNTQGQSVIDVIQEDARLLLEHLAQVAHWETIPQSPEGATLPILLTTVL